MSEDMVNQDSHPLLEILTQFPPKSMHLVIGYSKKIHNDPATFSDFWDVENFWKKITPDDPAAVLEAARLLMVYPKKRHEY